MWSLAGCFDASGSLFNVHVNCHCCTWACVCLKSSTCLSGWWLCVPLEWRNSSPLLKFRGFVCDSREYFGGRGIARCPLLHSFRENFSDFAVYVGGERIAHRPSSSQRRHVPRRKREGLLPHKIGEFLGGGGTGLLPRNVGEYMQLVLRCVLSMSALRGVPALRMRLCWGTTQALVRWSPRRTWKKTLQVQVGVKESRSGPGFIST